MARQQRRTEPLETRDGVLTDYVEIERLLSKGEMTGRRWAFEHAQVAERALRAPDDHDILELHRVMFGEFLPWAGTTRVDDRGPGGKVQVPWSDVRVALRNLVRDIAAWVGAETPVDLGAAATVIADAHHRFQWIHPFQDTNGRTGRVLDHYLLWVTFGLAGSTLETSPTLEYFPSESHEDEYYDGLLEADNGHPERLRAFYLERVVELFEAT